MPTPIDLALIVLFAVVWGAYEHFFAWPLFLRRLASGAPGVRVQGFAIAMAVQWAFTALTFAAWRLERHPWSLLRIGLPTGARLWVGAGLCVLLAALMAMQALSLTRRRIRPATRQRIAYLDPIIPHSPAELRWFMGLSLTAGVCEEWLFRGFATAVLTPLTGLPIAVLLCNIAFGFAHAYQGRAGIVRAGLLGLVMSAIVIGTGSLVPAMVLHALIDMGGGVTTYLILTRPLAEAPAAA